MDGTSLHRPDSATWAPECRPSRPTTRRPMHSPLLDDLGISSAVVIAVSAGAQSATRLALLHPERVQALALITPALYLPPDPNKLTSAPRLYLRLPAGLRLPRVDSAPPGAAAAGAGGGR